MRYDPYDRHRLRGVVYDARMRLSDRIARPDHGSHHPTGLAAGLCGSVTLVALVAYLVWRLLFVTHVETLTAESFAWERKIGVERFQPVQHEGWNHPPADAYNESSGSRVHHYDRVLVGFNTYTYKCGTSTCTSSTPIYVNVPVYQTYYWWTRDEWAAGRWIVTGATERSTPYWADLTAEVFVDEPVLGNERLSGTRTERYTVTLVSASTGRSYDREVGYEVWRSLERGSEREGNLNARGTLRSVRWYP